MNLVEHLRRSKSNDISYSRTTPPPSIEEAKRRVDELEDSIARIEADLMVKTERDYGHPDAYDKWKICATRSQAYKQKERLFLLSWIDSENGIIRKPTNYILDEKHLDILRKEVEKFLETSTPYVRVFTPENKPTSLSQLKGQILNLGKLRNEYSSFLSQLKTKSIALTSFTKASDVAKEKVVQIIDKIGEEHHFLKCCLEEIRKEDNNKSTSDPDQKNGNTESVEDIFERIRKVKSELGMQPSEMVIWLFGIISDQKTDLNLTAEQSEKLGIISRFVELTNERRLLESTK